MVRIALVGDPGSGGSTVLGLLYATQVRWSAADASAFRFHVAPSSMQRVGEIFERLKAGDFPARAPEPRREPIEFLFEPPATFASTFTKRWLPGTHPTKGATTIAWTRAGLDDLRAHLACGGFPTEGARQLEGADVLAVLVPVGADDGTNSSARLTWDDTIARMVSTTDRENRDNVRTPTTLAFVFTMLDRLSDARRRAVGLPDSLDSPVPPDHRATLGARLLKQMLPQTAALFGHDRLPVRPGSLSATYFFSWVETDPANSGRLRLRPAPGGGWEPAYPFVEYVALIGACGQRSGGER
jgi:hypothetical protein